jgi:hypothetical protein
MKFLTKKEVSIAAKKSAKAALKCTIRHWEELSTCTETQLRGKMNTLNDVYDIKSSCYCALCIRYNIACSKCIIVKRGHRSCPRGTWHEPSVAFHKWQSYGKPFSAFQKAAKKMLKLLKSLEKTS